MSSEVRLPELGENIEAGDIIQVLVSVGDTIDLEQPIIELETDKAVVEVPSPVSGKVTKIHVKAGESLKVGAVVLLVDVNSGDTIAGKQEAVEDAPTKEEAKDVIESEPHEPDKPVEQSSSAEIKPEAAEVPQVEAKLPVEKPIDRPSGPRNVAPAAPSVRRLAREIGIDINQVAGSGPSGRISADDIKNHSKKLLQGGSPLASVQVEILPDFSKWGEIERKPMSNVRRKTAHHLSYAWATIPHVTQYDKADITNVEKFRKEFGKKVEQAGAKLTTTAILIKIVASALKLYQQFNASVDMANNEIIYKNYLHIGVAVDTERGLLVPVIRNVDQKNIIEISIELAELAAKARDKKISLEEMQGASFTISNLGGLGGTYFSPVINSPEVAILGVSRGKMEPVYIDGEFIPRLMLQLSLSYDHRVIDGAEAVRCLRWTVGALEQPFLISLEG